MDFTVRNSNHYGHFFDHEKIYLRFLTIVESMQAALKALSLTAKGENTLDEDKLRAKVVESIKLQGFKVNPHLEPINNAKSTIRKIHEQKRNEQIFFHKKFLERHLKLAEKYAISGQFVPENIELELMEVKPNSVESRLFFWWNLIWWSLPFDKPIGRQMRFLIWDKGHNAPFGLICLQSPPLKSAVRDNYLNLSGSDTTYWINQSMYAQRVGALPPYNDLIGGKMVALSLVCNEIRDAYSLKYKNRKTLLKERELPSNLLFITTSSAYGKSSMYERITYKNERIEKFIGFTSGAGTFHISEPLYLELLTFLEHKGINAKRGYGTGSSRKLKLITKALSLLNLPKFSFHNINRGYYLFSNVNNLVQVINNNKSPIWYNRPFDDLSEYWKARWCLPRSIRKTKWKSFCFNAFFREASKMIELA